MRLCRVYVEDNKVTNQVWYDNPEGEESLQFIQEVLKHFPDESWYFAPHSWGVETDSNIVTIHQCTRPNLLERDIMYNSTTTRTIYNLDTLVKTYEIFWNRDLPQIFAPFPAEFTIRYVSEMLDADAITLNEHSVYVKADDMHAIYAFADSLNPNITKPVPVDSEMHSLDTVQFKFDTNDNLTNLIVFAHPSKKFVRTFKDGKRGKVVEYTVDYIDSLVNLNETALVKAKYDSNGYPIPSDMDEKDIREYIKLPVKGSNSQFRKVLVRSLPKAATYVEPVKIA